jgi:hypothetical protein
MCRLTASARRRPSRTRSSRSRPTVAKGADKSEITVAAVLKYARELRERASRARVRDPYAKPYEITDAARKVSQQFGPAKALEVIATRARSHELRIHEGEARAVRAHSELVAVQMVAKGERTAEQAAASLGERLDVALLAIGMCSETPAARLDGDRITGSKTPDRVWTGRRRLERDAILGDAEHLVRRAERLVESTRRRMVEEQAA